MRIKILVLAGVFLFLIAPSITLAAAPTVSSLSPTDGATGVSTDANLVITFDQSTTATTTISSYVTIKKASDDSTIEAIDVSGGQISGSGSATITINPSVTLANNTEYYVQIDNDAFYNASDEYYTGISDTTTWNFTTLSDGSVINSKPYAPEVDVHVDGNTATIGWSYSRRGSVFINDAGFTYTNNSGTTNISFGNVTVGATYVVRELECGQTYTFKAYAQNNVGTTYSDPVKVTAQDCPAQVEEMSNTTDETTSDITNTSETSTASLKDAFTSLLPTQAPNDLSVTSTGLPVTYLQIFLMLQNTGPAAQALIEVGPTDYFGQLTKAALAEYQTQHNIAPARGYYGSITRSYLSTL